MSRTDVTIDRVVLHGVQPAERDALVGGLKSELVRLLSEPGGPLGGQDSRRTPVLRVGGLRLEDGPSGHRKFGHGIARAIAKEVAR